MTGEELNTLLNTHRGAAGSPKVGWRTASVGYRNFMEAAATQLQPIGGQVLATPATAAAATSQPVAAPATPSTPGVPEKLSEWVAGLSQTQAQITYELLHTMRGTRIYKH